MAANFNLNQLWRQYSLTGNETLQVAAFNGTISLVMFRKGSENRKPAVKFTLSRCAQLDLVELLKKLQTDPPSSRIPLVQQRFNKDSRTYEIDTQFVFVKDEHRCYSIEVSNKYMPTPVKFPIKASATYSLGSEPLSDERRSATAMKELIELFESVTREAALLSRFGMENTRGGSSNNGGYKSRDNNNPNRGASRDPFNGVDSFKNEEDVFGAAS